MKNGQRNIFYVYTDHLGSSNVITDAAGAPKERHNFDAWGRERNSADWSYADVQTQCIASLRGYTGHEMLPEFGLINMNGRLYDPVLGRMLSPDPFVQAPGNSQNYNRYSYVLNNPLKFTDPDGEWVNFVIGAVIGGISGWQIGKANGAQGFWEWTGYIGGGMVIGAASSGAAAGVSALGGGAVLAGTAAGAVSGIGFAGLASGWNGNAMVTGGINGAVTGFVGSGFGAAIGGGGGAFVGGAASNITSQLLNNDGKISEINWYSVGTSATVSYGMYEISSYLNWKYEGGNKLGGLRISYNQYKTMQADFQRSRFWGKEYGGFLMNDGSVKRFSASERHNYGIGGNNQKITIPDGVGAVYHTHWDRPNRIVWTNQSGDRVDNSSNPLALLNPGVRQMTTARGHGAYDYLSYNSYVINRYETTFNMGGTRNISTINDPFLRYFLFY